MKSKNKGFTLVELSIVIVIIGLIVAGVVGGQSLVKQAKLRAIVSDVNSYNIAVNTFLLEYNELPGDLSNAYSYWGAACGANTIGANNSCNGNGDKKITGAAGLSAPVEDLKFWRHLSLAELIGKDYTGVFSGALRWEANINAPTMGLGKRNVVHLGVTTQAEGMINTNVWYYDKNAFLLSTRIQSSVGTSGGNFLTAKEALNIDSKVDDGLANEGSYQTIRGATLSGNTNCIDASGNYYLANEINYCRSFWLMSIN